MVRLRLDLPTLYIDAVVFGRIITANPGAKLDFFPAGQLVIIIDILGNIVYKNGRR